MILTLSLWCLNKCTGLGWERSHRITEQSADPLAKTFLIKTSNSNLLETNTGPFSNKQQHKNVVNNTITIIINIIINREEKNWKLLVSRGRGGTCSKSKNFLFKKKLGINFYCITEQTKLKSHCLSSILSVSIESTLCFNLQFNATVLL